MITLYQHIKMKDVAVEVTKWYPLINDHGEPCVRIKIRWWNVVPSSPPYCMNLIEKLTDASIEGNVRKRRKYPLKKWKEEWNIYEPCGRRQR